MMDEMRLIDANALDLRNRVETDMGGLCFIEDVEIAIEQAPTIDPESLRPAWVPVTERLPETDEHLCDCLVWTKDLKRGRSFIMAAITDGRDFGNPINGGLITNRVTHWMPMPEPPKE